MKLTILGGGAFRNLPILRSALATPALLTGGEVCLFDLNPARAEAMGRMVMKTPEYAAVGCPIRWDLPVEEALSGADAVSISFPCGSLEANWRSNAVSRSFGFMSSDNVSPTGAMLALFGGPIILNYARMMERYCPQAWFTIFANPVAIYSTMVNNHTRIRALGVCGGYANHMWDLTRLTGVEGMRTDYDVDVAGINHLSFILRGTAGGADLFPYLESFINKKGWRPPLTCKRHRWLQHHIHFALRKMIDMYRKLGTMIFSTEGDGMAHLYYDECFERGKREVKPATRAQLRTRAEAHRQRRLQADAEFRALLDQELDAKFWDPTTRELGHFGREDSNVTVRILRALGGLGAEKVVASRPNHGAVAGFTDRTGLEYSFHLTHDGVTPTPDLAVPAPLHGLIAALADFQTLTADAIATGDPRTLYQALYAYPIKQNSADARACYRALLDVHKDEMPAVFQETKAYLKG